MRSARSVRLSRGARVSALGLLVAAAVGTSACTFDGVNSIPLPGNTASGSTYQITVDLADAQNLVGNSPVKSENVTVGNIRKIVTDGWHAQAVLDIDSDTDLPGNVNATLAQTSLFGSQYIELHVPDGQQPEGRLGNGAHLGLNRSDGYPAVEDVLSSLSLVLNGSALQQVRTISTEVDQVLAGRQENARQVIDRLQPLVDTLNSQRDQIGNVIDAMGRLSTELDRQKEVIGAGIDALQPAIDVVNNQEKQLVSMLDSVGRFGQVATSVLDNSHQNLVSDLQNLAPTLDGLAKAGDNLTEALKIALTLPFPVMATDRGIKGDYLNLFLTLDISPGKLANVVLPSLTRQPRNPAPRTQGNQTQTARGSADPMLAPLTAGRTTR
ncbi:MCE family protein [Gordonia polyisoprenivorans]|uniref:MCE family protein n=1 Tax=Gordonia polyisoprenivorans TaxID=84595 RepID=UPI000B99EEC6|nr:MCE family protein [Gordonia polyisoprenivorans]OZC29212.1 mammalian cell entry protein [Gordonia polyisoprenivorans]